MCATSSYFSNWPKNVFLANFWNTSIFNSCNQHFSYNGCTENHQTLHEDAQYYVDVQRLGFFQIGSKMYFCDFFSKIWKIFFFIFAKSLFSILFFLCIDAPYLWFEVYEMALFFLIGQNCILIWRILLNRKKSSKHHFYYSGYTKNHIIRFERACWCYVDVQRWSYFQICQKILFRTHVTIHVTW